METDDIQAKLDPTSDDGGPAFPVKFDPAGFVREGMSLRDYFAAAALTGWVSDESVTLTRQNSASGIAASCYKLADAMLAERRK